MTLLVRNEADMLEANVDYHLSQGVDAVIVTDHGSTDATPEILRRYERDGVVHVLRDGGEGHHQSIRVTRMAELALTQHAADWVFHNDADEFWWPLVGNLRDVFSAFPAEYGQVVVRRHNFLPRPDGPGVFDRLIYREEKSLNLIGLALEPKVAHRASPDAVIGPGNHSLVPGGGEAVPISELLEIFHFPQRSYQQFEAKVLQTGIGYERLPLRSPGVGRDQLALLALHRQGALNDFYEQRVLNHEQLRDHLAAQDVVLDRRLSEYMKHLSSGPPAANRPDSAAARSVIGQALQACLSVAGARAELAQERIRADVAVSESLAAQRALLEVSESLRLLRESRVVRWSRPARLLYHRIVGSWRQKV